MRCEGDGDRLGFLLTGALHDVTENVLVGAMHTVEVPDAHYCRAEVWRNVFELVKDLHKERAGRLGQGRARSQTPVSCRHMTAARVAAGRYWFLRAASRDRCG